MEGHGRSWNVMEGHKVRSGRAMVGFEKSQKVMEGLVRS